MSRIGKKPIEIPDGVTVKISKGLISVSGPKGSLERKLLKDMQVEQSEGKLFVRRPDDDRRSRAQQGLLRALIANMVTGVDKGFEKALEISGVGYRAEMTGKNVTFHLGYSHKIDVPIPDKIEVVVDKPTHVIVRGVDRELVGQVAAKIRSLRKPDPYKVKGITYEGERILKKAGKKAIG